MTTARKARDVYRAHRLEAGWGQLLECGFTEALLAQLKDGGRIACLFMDGPLGEVRLGYKSERGISWRKSFNAAAPVLDGFTRAKEFQL